MLGPDSRTRRLPVYFAVTLCLVFLQALLCGMILNDPRPLYLGSWDITALVIFMVIVFVLLPAAVTMLFSVLAARLSEDLLYRVFAVIAAGLLAREVDYFVFREMFVEGLLLRVALMTLAFGVLLFVLFRIRAVAVTFCSISPICSVMLAAYFAYAVGVQLMPLGSNASAETQRAAAASKGKGHVFFITFERVLHDHLFEADNTIDADKYPNFARLVGTSNTYHNAYANAKHTWLALKHAYTGTYDAQLNAVTEERDYRRNLNEIESYLGARGWRVVFVTDTATQFCDKRSSICINALGDTSMRRRLSVIKGWFQEYLKIFIPTGLLAETGILPTWDVLLWQDIVDTDALRRKLGMTGQPTRNDIGRAEMDLLIEAMQKYNDRPTVFISHNLFNHDVQMPVSGLFEPVDPVAYNAARNEVREALAELDQILGGFLNALDENEIFDNSTIVIASDTGNDMNAGKISDQSSFNDTPEFARIYLSIKFPDQTAGKAFNGTMRQIDIFPTVLDALGLDPNTVKMDGVAVTDPDAPPSLDRHPVFLILNVDDIYRLERPLGKWLKVN